MAAFSEEGRGAPGHLLPSLLLFSLPLSVQPLRPRETTSCHQWPSGMDRISWFLGAALGAAFISLPIWTSQNRIKRLWAGVRSQDFFSKYSGESLQRPRRGATQCDPASVWRRGSQRRRDTARGWGEPYRSPGRGRRRQSGHWWGWACLLGLLPYLLPHLLSPEEDRSWSKLRTHNRAGEMLGGWHGYSRGTGASATLAEEEEWSVWPH